jgi:glycosyltransferase involved in cell wall biosynthesis
VKILRPKKSAEQASVTVVVPCYNYGRFLSQVVASILEQERVNARVIIVDDASTDDSATIARLLAASDSRIEVVIHDENQGHIRTYNDGLQRVLTPYAALLSADDLLAPGALARATDLMTNRPEVGMVYGRPLAFTDPANMPKLPKGFSATWTVWRGQEWIGWAARRGRCFILSPEVVMRTEAMNKVGYYNPDLPHSGDLEYWLRMAAQWDVGRVNRFAQAMYRLHGVNMHLVSYGTMAADLSHRLKAFRVLNPPNSFHDPALARLMYQRARRAIAREALLLAERELDSGGSQKTAASLVSVAREADHEVEHRTRYKIYRRHLRRAEAGNPPRVTQRLKEFGRGQINRVRWRVWDAVGIS